MKTFLSTGRSSRFSVEIARAFLAHADWTLVATMRTSHRHILPALDRLRVVALDVTGTESVRRSVDVAGQIDLLINNAGTGYINALEGAPMTTGRDVSRRISVAPWQ